jgi:hypothetical protein
MNEQMSLCDPVTCDIVGLAPGATPTADQLLAQYACLYSSIMDATVPALTQIQGQIVANAAKIEQLQQSEMMGLVAGENGAQLAGTTSWPSYSIAFVCMFVAFLLLIIVVDVVLVRQFGQTTKSIAFVVVGTAFAMALFLVLVQRLV